MGLKENVLFHPKPVQGFACNIVFIEEPMPRKMKLSEATDASIAFMEKNIHEFRVTERREIKGSNGVMMERVRYRGRFLQQGVTSKNIVYVIPLGEDRLLSITVSGIEFPGRNMGKAFVRLPPDFWPPVSIWVIALPSWVTTGRNG